MRDKPITHAQIKALQAIFSQKGFSQEDRHEFIANYTDGRTASTKELTSLEATQLFRSLGGESNKVKALRQENARRLVGIIYGLSLKIDFLNKDYDTDDPVEFEMNKAKLNLWCRTKTKAKKDIAKMSLEELEATRKQLEAILRKQKP